jgi:ABC-type transporter Mla subunit MlaD
MAAANHNFTKTEFKAGLLVITSGIVLAVFVATTLNLRPPEETKEFYMSFVDTAGLNRGADVRFGGVISGRITDIAPSPDAQSLIRVTALVPATTPINEASTAYITQTSLTANQHLQITTGSDTAPLLESGSEIPASVGGLIGDVRLMLGMVDEAGQPTTTDENRKTVEHLLVDLGAVLLDVQLLVGAKDDQGNPTMTDEELITVAEIFVTIGATIGSSQVLIEDITGVVDENKEGLGDIVTQAGGVAIAAGDLIGDLDSMLAENRDGIGDIIVTVSGTIDSLSSQLDGLLASLQGTLDNADALSDDARVLLEDNAPVLEDIILDVREVMRNMKDFTRTLADEPQSVIRGKTPTGRR